MSLQEIDSQSAVRVWHATSSTGGPGPVERSCEAWLDDDERTRADRFRLPTSRNQHVVGRGMARQLLAKDSCSDSQVHPTSVRFAAAVHGKPYVTEPEEAKRPFNVAHTDGLVMCGIGNQDHHFVGIDVEKLDRRTHPDPDLANRYFSQPEIRYLQRYTSESERRHAFLRIWTLKESFIKAIGTGLQTPLADFAFENIDSASPTIRMLSPKLESNLQWNFFSIQPRPGYIGALAVGWPPTHRTIELQMHCFDDLIQ